MKKYKEWTEGRRRSFLVSLIRSGMRRYPAKYQALDKAYIGTKLNKATNRKAKHWECNKCKGHFPQKQINVDHIEPVVDPQVGFVNWDTFINRMFCSPDNLQVLCLDCHKVKTQQEQKAKNANTSA